MFVDRKPFIYVWRPLYRFAERARQFALATLRTDVAQSESRLKADLTQIRRDIAYLSDRTSALRTEIDHARLMLAQLQQSAVAHATELAQTRASMEAQLGQVRTAVETANADAHRQWEAMERLVLFVSSERAMHVEAQ
jgi:septation ring formation regulator EzrA